MQLFLHRWETSHFSLLNFRAHSSSFSKNLWIEALLSGVPATLRKLLCTLCILSRHPSHLWSCWTTSVQTIGMLHLLATSKKMLSDRLISFKSSCLDHFKPIYLSIQPLPQLPNLNTGGGVVGGVLKALLKSSLPLPFHSPQGTFLSLNDFQ